MWQKRGVGVVCRLLRSRRSFHTSLCSQSVWSHLQLAPLDGNHATAAAFEEDTSDLKVNLGRGVYKDDNGKDFTLPCVQQAIDKIFQEKRISHSYLKFNGDPKFAKLSARFAFGEDNPVLADNRVATVQTISGTGALRVGAEFLARFLPSSTASHVPRSVYIPTPSYVNHTPIFLNNSFHVKRYRYYDPKTCGLDFTGMIKDIETAPAKSVFLFHACAHNPTGVDPNFDQWKSISDVAKAKEHVIFFDCAYQGFASGDPDQDAQAFRYFVEQGHTILLAQSYAKNFGLYGQRVGALNIVTDNAEETKVVLSQLNQVIRPMYSNPPAFGANIVATIFDEENLYKQWRKDVKVMADRIIGCRKKLVDELKRLGSKRDWSHIVKQIGMFAYSGLDKTEVEALRNLHVYMNLDGRMSMTGVNSHNVEYLAQSMHNVTASTKA